MKALKDRLVEARTESGLSQAQLAKAVGAGQSTIASIENGRNKGSSLFLDLARALNVNVEWLVDGTGSKRDTVSSLQTDHRKIASAWPFPDISEEDVRALPKAHINALQGALALAIAQLKLGVKISTHVTMMRGGQPANGTAPDEFPMTATRHDNPWEGGTTTRYEESLLQLHISRTPKVGHVPKAGYSADDQDLLPVPELDVRLAAGELGIENYEETAIGEILFRRSFLESFKLPLSRMKIVYAQGDSMEPVIRNGGPMLFFE
ncbi:helix-turn-helix domain-containing protein, partial [Achromobacter marplatensis]